MKIKVEDIVTLSRILERWENLSLKKISWCLARNKVKIDPIVDTARKHIEPTEPMKQLQKEIDRIRVDNFAMRDESGEVIRRPVPGIPGRVDVVVSDLSAFEAAALELREMDEWKEASEDEKRMRQLWADILQEEEDIDFYKIPSDVFEQYNEDKDGNAIIPMGDQAFFYKVGIIEDSESEENVTPIKGSKRTRKARAK